MTYTHVVISGGGLYGVCMLGVLRYLYRKIVDVKNIAGNSMGAFFALAHSLKIDVLELEHIIKELACNCSLLITKKIIFQIFSLKMELCLYNLYK